MIKPDRYLNPDWSVLNIGSFVLQKLSAHYFIKYDELLDLVITALGKETRENFPYALNFLYLLGKIEYSEQNDSFRLNEAK